MSEEEDEDSREGVVVPEIMDDPKWSSAALCIQLSLLDYAPFRPEFTHQCFPGEVIRGYQPHYDVLPSNKRHKSYAEHAAANQELQVLVRLAPSCQICHIQVQARKKRAFRQLHRPSRGASRKRVKLNNGDAKDTNELSVGDSQENCSSSETVPEEEEEEEDFDGEASEFSEEDDNDDEEYLDDESVVGTSDGMDPTGDTRNRRMSPSEISHCLAKALPTVARRRGEEEIQNDYLKQPVGDVLHTYTRKGHDYCVSLADGKEAGPYHTSVQRLALLFIENADDVDITADDGGYWKVLYLFQKHSETNYSLAAFVTLFHFTSPFRKPVPGTIVRICQAVVLPPYQRCGHGRELLHCIHYMAQGKTLDDTGIGKSYGASIVEINVEDPAPGFVALRNLVDYELYLSSKNDQSSSIGGGDWFHKYCQDASHKDYFEGLSEGDAKELSRKSKLTVQQMQIVYEINRLWGLQQAALLVTGDKSSRSSSIDEDLEKKFRLMVKKRLNRDHKEELSYCRNKDAMKQLLDELYTQQRTMYDTILLKAQKTTK